MAEFPLEFLLETKTLNKSLILVLDKSDQLVYQTYKDFRDSKLSKVPGEIEENLFPARFLLKTKRKTK